MILLLPPIIKNMNNSYKQRLALLGLNSVTCGQALSTLQIKARFLQSNNISVMNNYDLGLYKNVRVI